MIFFIGNVVKRSLLVFRKPFNRYVIKAPVSTKSTDYNESYSTNISQIQKCQSSDDMLYLLDFSSSLKSAKSKDSPKPKLTKKSTTKYDVECDKWC